MKFRSTSWTNLLKLQSVLTEIHSDSPSDMVLILGDQGGELSRFLRGSKSYSEHLQSVLSIDSDKQTGVQIVDLPLFDCPHNITKDLLGAFINMEILHYALRVKLVLVLPLDTFDDFYITGEKMVAKLASLVQGNLASFNNSIGIVGKKDDFDVALMGDFVRSFNSLMVLNFGMKAEETQIVSQVNRQKAWTLFTKGNQQERSKLRDFVLKKLSFSRNTENIKVNSHYVSHDTFRFVKDNQDLLTDEVMIKVIMDRLIYLSFKSECNCTVKVADYVWNTDCCPWWVSKVKDTIQFSHDWMYFVKFDFNLGQELGLETIKLEFFKSILGSYYVYNMTRLVEERFYGFIVDEEGELHSSSPL
ncbi:Hypothetical predicted protein [Cloeon dipterum]|uniref:Uncharacterized protein n=1 Tax=Cloeon dipterum TaxID=197152 RepID=A0A8S1CGN2_9INSE|nr:Hypothetical predicted protein [Cloeon dipterum]